MSEVAHEPKNNNEVNATLLYMGYYEKENSITLTVLREEKGMLKWNHRKIA